LANSQLYIVWCKLKYQGIEPWLTDFTQFIHPCKDFNFVILSDSSTIKLIPHDTEFWRALHQSYTILKHTRNTRTHDRNPFQTNVLQYGAP